MVDFFKRIQSNPIMIGDISITHATARVATGVAARCRCLPDAAQHGRGTGRACGLGRFFAFNGSGGASRFSVGARGTVPAIGKLTSSCPGPRQLSAPAASEVPLESIELSLEAEATAPRVARRFLREALATQNLDGFGDVSELLTTELVTNVVLHARSPIKVRLVTSGERLHVEVDDASSRVPVVQRPEPERSSGKGLFLVDQLASDWGVDTWADGKTVWFEIDLCTATEEIHGESP